jgi:hypothetical protein
MFSDWAVSGSSDNEHVLMRFDNIVGTDTNQIPPGAQVHAAMLDLAGVTADAMGDGGRFFALLQPWQDTTSTWNFWTNGIQADGVEAALTPTATAGNASLNPDVQGGFNSFEVTPDVQSWVSGTRANYGWVILPWPNGGNGWGMSSAESAEGNRPQLRVFYTATAVNNIVLLPPIWSPTSVTVRFTGVVSNTYSVLRAPAVTGQYTTNGTATVGQDGTATFTDNAPLPGAAFYRISYP